MDKDLQSAKEKLQELQEKTQESAYNDWDSLVIVLAKGDETVGSIKMMRHDMQMMQETHMAERSNVIEMMIQALEEEARNKKEK